MKKEDIIEAARERMEEAIEADRDNREEALDDLNNLAGRQWPENIRQDRESANRPCLTINRLPQFTRQVTGDIRRMDPAINVLPGDDRATDEVASIIEGIIRKIQYRCDASSVYERAAESAAQCGMGFFRVRHDYIDETSFNQDIIIETIHNPFSVYVDPNARLSTREDMDYCFITEKVKHETFKEMYPGAQTVDVDNDGQTDNFQHWREGDEVIVAEYFWKEPLDKELVLLKDGRVVEDFVEGMDYVRKRKVKTNKVMWAKVSGKDVLEGPTEMATKHIPVIAIMGEEIHTGPDIVRTSVIRFAKDPQRLYNYWRSAQTELIALQPKAPFMVTPKQVAGFETFWKNANDANYPYLPFNPDEKNPGAPQRSSPPIASQGMMQEVITSNEDMKATTGIYDSALGNKSNEESGVAIRQRQTESDISTSIYADNMGKAVQHCGRIIVDMIPRIYDTQRLLRIMEKDGKEQQVTVNQMMMTQEGPIILNNIRTGNYDVKVTVGPNFTTKRQEAAESMMAFVNAVPNAASVVSDLIAKNMDWPGADEFADRLKKMLPPNMLDPEDMSPEELQAMQQAQQAQQAAQQIEMRKSEAETAEAEFDAQKAQFEMMEKQLELSIANGQLNAAIQQAVARALQGAF